MTAGLRFIHMSLLQPTKSKMSNSSNESEFQGNSYTKENQLYFLKNKVLFDISNALFTSDKAKEQ